MKRELVTLKVSDEIRKQVERLDGWELKDGKIRKDYGFPSFVKGIEFVNNVAEIAESQNHHPIITIIWKTVKISSISFDVGHLTDRDFRLAKAIDDLYKEKYEKKLKEEESDEDELLLEEERREKARKRTRGPYRKSSRAGL